MRTLSWVSGLSILAIVIAAAQVEEGELVTLVTRDAQGREWDERLWVVDLDGVAWVRAPGLHTGWVERLRSEPVARLYRQGQLATVHGLPDPSPVAREAVERAMARKYGALDRVVGWLRAPEAAVPVRLVPHAPESRTR